MKNLYLLILSFLLFHSNSIKATHLLGGNSRIEQIGTNLFIVHIEVMTSCGNNTLPTTISNVEVHDKVTNGLISTNQISRDSIVNYSSPTSIRCFDINYYSDTITLANNPNGYYTTWTNGPRYTSQVLNYTGSSIHLWNCDFADPAITGGNSSPTPNSIPMTKGICFFQNTLIDFSSIDPDGDSLVYSLSQSINSLTSTNHSKPFSFYFFTASHNLTNLLGPGSTCAINPSSGILTVRATFQGQYIIAVKCEEYRNGLKIGETIRDYNLVTENCRNTSIEKLNMDEFVSIYPNPNNGEFNLNIENPKIGEINVSVFDMYGRVVYNNQLQNKNNLIQLADVASGVYTVRISNENQTTVKKIVVN